MSTDSTNISENVSESTIKTVLKFKWDAHNVTITLLIKPLQF